VMAVGAVFWLICCAASTTGRIRKSKCWVAGFYSKPSSRTAGRAVNRVRFRRSLVSGGRCGLVLVGGVAVLRSCTAALAARRLGLAMNR